MRVLPHRIIVRIVLCPELIRTEIPYLHVCCHSPSKDTSFQKVGYTCCITNQHLEGFLAHMEILINIHRLLRKSFSLLSHVFLKCLL